MSAMTISNRNVVASPHDDRATGAAAPALGFVARVMRGAMARHLRIRAARELHSLPADIRHDIGVPEHVIEEVAAEAAAREADAWARRVFGSTGGRLAA